MSSATSREAQEPGLAPDWTTMYAFGLPAGSVRALLTLAVLGTSGALAALRPDRPLPDYLRDLLFLILGHYFALRRGQAEPQQLGPPPLFLPRGTIRWVITLGYVAVAALLIRHGGALTPARTPAYYTMLIVGGFLLGVATSKVAHWLSHRGRHPRRLFMDLRAAFTLLAAAILLLLAWNHVFEFLPAAREVPLGRVRAQFAESGFEFLLSAIVGFYFGARS